MDEYISIGKIVKSHGVHGEVKVRLFFEWEGGFDKLETVFLEENRKPVPWFIESLRQTAADELLIKLEGLDSKEAATTLNGKEIYVSENTLPLKLSSDSFGFLMGYMAHDMKSGKLGRIEHILDLPGQEVAEINRHNREILVPLTQEFIKCIDNDRKLVLFRLPDSYIEEYLG